MTCRTLLSILCVVILISVNHRAMAVSCLAVFPEAVSSSSANAEINFANNAVLYGTDTILDVGISSATDPLSLTCDSAACSSSGNQSAQLQLPSFSMTTSSTDINVLPSSVQNEIQGDYDDVELGDSAVLTISSNNVESRFDHITLQNNAELVLSGGVYWINTLEMKQNSSLSIASAERVTIYLNQSVLDDNIDFNTSGTEEQLVLVVFNDFTSGEYSSIRGFLHVSGELTWAANSEFFGAMHADDFEFGVSSTAYTRLSDIGLANFNEMCDETSTLPEPIAYYSMDACSINEGSNSITDDIGNNDGDSENGLSSDYSGKFCQAAKFDGSDDFIEIPDAVFNGLSQGSISFYFSSSDFSHSAASAYGGQSLLSRDASGRQSAGHLSMWVSDDGGLEVRQQNASNDYYTYTAANVFQEDTWHHIVHTWGPDGIHTYTDGVLRDSNSNTNDGFTDSGPSMVFGASAWKWNASSSAQKSAQLTDFFKGSIDELKIYNQQLSATQVTEFSVIESQACLECITEVELIAHWSSDVCSTSSNTIVDLENGINATLQNGISLTSTSRFCQGLKFDGEQSYATVLHDSLFEIEEGAISLWFKIEDLSHSSYSYAGGNTLFSKDRTNTSTDGHVDVRVDADGKIQVRHQTTSNSYYFNTDAIVQEDKWHHLTYSFGSQGVRIYLDGELEKSDENFNVGLDDNIEILVFGASSRRSSLNGTSASNFNDFLLGELDNIRFYKNQPSDADVASWFLEDTVECTTCETLIGEYRFDQDDPESSTIRDTSGQDNDGSLGSALSLSLIEQNASCWALETSTATGSLADYYFNTGIRVDNEIGTQGSISFWFYSRNDWNDGVNRQILDANNPSTRKYFFMTKMSDGALRFGFETADDNDLLVETASNNTPANSWVHITLTWNVLAKKYSIYFDGIEQPLAYIYDEIENDTMGEFETLVFGDNRSGYNVNGSATQPANAYFDDIRVYAQVIGSTQIQEDMNNAQSCATVDHYLIEHPASALTCESPQVTIKACLDANCDSLSTVPSSITLLPDTFTSSSSVVFTGQTSMNLSYSNAGTLILSSSAQNPIAPVICDSDDCEILFAEVGVQFFNTQTNETNFDDSYFTAEDSLALLGLRIVGSDDGQICQSYASETEDIELSYECVQTNTIDYTPALCNVSFAGIALSGNTSQTGTLAFSFDSQGESNFANYSYADAGLLRISAGATIDGLSILPASVDIKSIPANLVIQSSAQETNTAGESLSLGITAKGANDTNLIGYQANNLQVSVQRLIPDNSEATDAQFHIEDNALTSSLSASFTDVVLSFNNGVFSTNDAYMEEVGTYVLDIQDANYLGATITADSVELGRFIPAYFDLNPLFQPLLENSCTTLSNTGFTNIGETFGFSAALTPTIEISAYNALGRVTRNYAGDLWKLNLDIASMLSEASIIDNSVYSLDISQVDDLSAISISGADLYDGKALISLSGYTFTYDKVALPLGDDSSPFDVDFDFSLSANWFTDEDAVCYQSSYPGTCEAYTFENIGGVNLRYSRINMDNAFGSETNSLSLPIFSEYLNAGQWRVNTDDYCTRLDLRQSAGDIVLTHQSNSFNNLASMEDDLSIATTMVAGQIMVNLGPYMLNDEVLRGSFLVNLVPKSELDFWSNYLNYDWDGDGDIDLDDSPSASVSFGLYRGNERTFNRREVLE